jgi:AraC-like DNA-binding protein
MKLGFTLFHCLRAEVGEQGPKGMHSHDMHEFFFCTNDVGLQSVEAKTIPNRKDSLFCFPAGVRHYCSGEPGIGAKGFVIMVPETMYSPEAWGDRETYLALERITALAREGQYPLPLDKKNARAIRALVEKMVDEYLEAQPGYQALVRSRLQEIIVRIARDPAINIQPVRPADAKHHDERIALVYRFIDERFMEKISVERIARLAGMSRSHFHLIFRAKSGCTLIEYVTRVRIRAALRLLHESDLAITQIALDCGFLTLSRFYEAFKAVTGKTPLKSRAGSV